MKQHILKAFLVFSLALFLTPGAFVSAQLIGSTDASLVNDRDIDVALTPEQPGPNQNVTIELSSYATEMNKATITWSVNGATKLNGIGKTKLSITTGDVGQKTDVSIVIITQEGTRVDKRIVITPAQLDILWEAPETYTPPFYKGKALPIKESKVRVFGMPVRPDGTVTPSNYSYRWEKAFKVDQSASGYGKYWFDTRNNYLNLTDTIGVTASGITNFGGTGSITLTYTNPKILFYEVSPAYGTLYQKNLNSGVTLGTKDMTIIAEPFFFSEKDGSVLEKSMRYLWSINNRAIPPPAKINQLTLRGSTETGVAKVSLSITNTLTLFQDAISLLTITLGGK